MDCILNVKNMKSNNRMMNHSEVYRCRDKSYFFLRICELPLVLEVRQGDGIYFNKKRIGDIHRYKNSTIDIDEIRLDDIEIDYNTKQIDFKLSCLIETDGLVSIDDDELPLEYLVTELKFTLRPNDVSCYIKNEKTKKYDRIFRPSFKEQEIKNMQAEIMFANFAGGSLKI